ncbi:MAG TPA: hypothetical protein VEC19_02485 [Usitatibacter sp.]|nr:hypothetical protein [Usitatibacter sp.]
MNNEIERKLGEVEAAARATPGSTCTALLGETHRRVERHMAIVRARLLGSPLHWTDEEKAEAAYAHSVHRRFARTAGSLAEALSRVGCADDEAMCCALAIALYYAGESFKSQVATGDAARPDYPAMHALMRLALWRGLQRRPIHLEAGAETLQCTPEGLYFRALTLARFNAGPLSAKQIEIMDTWICLWLPQLEATTEAPSRSALRADLDTRHGLRRGPREGPGESLYLAQDLVEQAHHTVVKALHRGRIVPDKGLVSTFRIEEHIAVLAQIRRGMQVVRGERIVRPERRASASVVEMHVGHAEIMARAFLPQAPALATTLSLATRDGAPVGSLRRERDHDVIPATIYEPIRRKVRIVDESDSGFGIEGSEADCGLACVGDLVGFRIFEDAPLVLCRVTRCVAAANGRIRIGAKRIAASARRVEVRNARGDTEPMLFVLGTDATGRQDGFVVTDQGFTRGARVEVALGERSFGLTMNRVRERGRGWLLAGFEVAGQQESQRYFEVA